MLSKQDLLCSEVKLGGMAELCAECYEGRTFGSHINMHELNCIGGKVHKLLLHLPSPIFDLNLRLPEGAVLNVRWKIANALLPPLSPYLESQASPDIAARSPKKRQFDRGISMVEEITRKFVLWCQSRIYLHLGLECVLLELPIVDGEADQGPATEEADDGGGEDDPGDGEEDSGGDGDGQRQDDLQQVEDAGGDGAGAVQHQGGEELQGFWGLDYGQTGKVNLNSNFTHFLTQKNLTPAEQIGNKTLPVITDDTDL